MDSETTPTETTADTTQAVAESTANDDSTKVTSQEVTTEAKDEAKPDTKVEGDDKSKEAKTEAKVPDSYEDFKSPDGLALDTEVLGDLKALGKELGLTQENAQKVFDLGVKLQQRNTEAWQAQLTKWVGEAKADKEIGGEKFAENLGLAKQAMSKFASREFLEYLDTSGLGNHPALIKTFFKVGKAISDDSFVPGGKNTGTRSLEDRLYGNTKA